MNSSPQNTGLTTSSTPPLLWSIPTITHDLSQPGVPPARNFTTPLKSGGVSEDVVFKQHVQRYAYGYLMLAVCGIGLVGNLLTLAVLSLRTMRSSRTTAAYLRSLAALDACVLVLAVFRYRSYYVLLSEREVIEVIVNFDRYVQVYVVPFFWVSLAGSSYIVLSLSLERYLVIRWPFTLRKSRWVMVVRAGTGVAVAAIFLVTLPTMLCYRMRRTTFRGLQVAAVQVTDRYLSHPREYLYVYNHYLIPLAWYAAPWAVVAVVNALLFRQVQKSSRIRVGVPNSLNPNRNLSLLIILIVAVYMICNLPRCVLALYCLADRCGRGSDGEDVGGRGFLVLKVTADLLNVLNSALNILVYCCTGAKFRRHLKRLLMGRWWCHQTAVSPLTHQSMPVSLREVAATPLHSPGSGHLSFHDLPPLPLPPGRLEPACHSRPCTDHPPRPSPAITLCSSCPQSSHSVDHSAAATAAVSSSSLSAASSSSFFPSSSSPSSSSSKEFQCDPVDLLSQRSLDSGGHLVQSRNVPMFSSSRGETAPQNSSLFLVAAASSVKPRLG
ncbi:hypothetical protein ACOMHN_037474 [Nucella lapillus]